MPIPDGFDCGLALSINCAGLNEDTGAYLQALAEVAEGFDARLQLFVSIGEFTGLAEDLGARGHAVDQLADAALPLTEGDAETLGLRPAQMLRGGIQKHEDSQQAILDAGFGFITSDYSTKLPQDPSDPGFADKNAAMLIKHSQPRRYPTGLLEIPAAGYSDRDFLQTQGRGVEQWTAHLAQCLDFAHDMRGLLYAPALHLSVLANHDPDMQSMKALLDRAASKRFGPVRLCTLREVWHWESGRSPQAPAGG